MWLGAHIGISDGLPEAPVAARRIGCEAIQIFSKSPQMWKGPPVADEAAAGFRQAVVQEGLRATAVHHGYLINLGTPKKSMLAISRKAFLDEIQRAEKLGVDQLIFHPGAHLGEGVDAGLARVTESLNWAIEKSPEAKVRLLLENAAGHGTALCVTFPELATVLAKVTDRSRVGVAIDTCHLFASGVDFRTESTYGEMIDRLDRELGLSDVHAFHLNDAKAGLASHLDRHENIGKGQLGVDGFRHLVNDPRWNATPGYLETPLAGDDYAAYEEDLKALRGLIVEAPTAETTTPKPAARRKKSGPAPTT